MKENEILIKLAKEWNKKNSADLFGVLSKLHLFVSPMKRQSFKLIFLWDPFLWDEIQRFIVYLNKLNSKGGKTCGSFKFDIKFHIGTEK